MAKGAQGLQIFVKDMQEQYQVIGVLPGKEIYFLGSDPDPQNAIIHALNFAKLLGVAERDVYVSGNPVTGMGVSGSDAMVTKGRETCNEKSNSLARRKIPPSKRDH